MIRTYIDKDNRFFEAFNTETGFYLRSGVHDEEGNDTEIDPFLRNYPQLLDVGIMGHCIHGKSGLCVKSGVECYQSGLTRHEPNMQLSDYQSIVEQGKDKVFQIALGGRGDPNKHENFKEILELTRKNSIVPNYTTSGLDLTDEEIALSKRHCGAVAVSWYGHDFTLNAINRFIKAGVKTNIHYVLGRQSIDEAIGHLTSNSFPEGVNAVIFLLHKPVGQGTRENVLLSDDPKVREFFNLVDLGTKDRSYKIGFDACSIPGILNFTKNIDRTSIDTCEGSRHSAYITSDNKMLPCSFDQDLRWAVDLSKNSILDAWNSEEFYRFRETFSSSCNGCSDQEECRGGCPIVREIVLCDRPVKSLADAE